MSVILAELSLNDISVIEKFIREKNENPMQFYKEPDIQFVVDAVKNSDSAYLVVYWLRGLFQRSFYLSKSGKIISLEFYSNTLKSYSIYE
jgi:hypothetical protein